jgi:peptide/nickel transport system substrate-binding protein
LLLTDLAAVTQKYDPHTWQVFQAAIGSWDPAADIGVTFRLASNGPFAGMVSPQIDKYLAQGISSQSAPLRSRAYNNLASVLSNQAVTPFICTPSSWDIAKKGVQGPGLRSVTANVGEGPLVPWKDVSVSQELEGPTREGRVPPRADRPPAAR